MGDGRMQLGGTKSGAGGHEFIKFGNTASRTLHHTLGGKTSREAGCDAEMLMRGQQPT